MADHKRAVAVRASADEGRANGVSEGFGGAVGGVDVHASETSAVLRERAAGE
jgi:hypothetical protein